MPYLRRITGYEYRAQAREILRVLSDKRNLRFGEIRDALRVQSPATLTRRLKELTKLGWVERTVKNIPGQSVVVTYNLTSDGMDALGHFDALENIAKRSRDRVASSQELVRG